MARMKFLSATILSAGLAAALCPQAFADDAAAPAGGIKVTGLIEAGATFNGNSSETGVNYGHLFTDKQDQLLLNQAMLTAQKDLDPKATSYDWGFKLQGMYGSDARYTHSLGVFDHSTNDRNQFDIVEANVLGHAPWLTEGGIDVKAGIYTTPLGAEVIQSSSNYLYSHSYIFNFSLPLKHTGALTTTHLPGGVDVYLGVDTGNQTTVGARGDNNSKLAGIAGVGLTLLDGNLTVLGLSHFGPNNAARGPNGVEDANRQNTMFNDVTVTWKATDALTLITELNYAKDDLAEAQAWGIAQYGVYAVNDWLSLVGRGEVYNDANRFFVAAFPGNRDFVNVERGNNAQTLAPVAAGNRVVYSELTLGANIKLPGLPERLEGTMLRPELRYDRTLNDVNAYNDFKDKDQFTVGVDLVVPVSLF